MNRARIESTLTFTAQDFETPLAIVEAFNARKNGDTGVSEAAALAAMKQMLKIDAELDSTYHDWHQVERTLATHGWRLSPQSKKILDEYIEQLRRPNSSH